MDPIYGKDLRSEASTTTPVAESGGRTMPVPSFVEVV